MQYFNSFVEIVGKNYYLEFLINPYDERVDYYQQYILILYQDEYYYEHNFDYIKNIQKRIINDSKELYHKSISEVLINLSNKNVDESIKFIDLLLKSLNYKIKILSNDIFIDDSNSRYYSIIYDNFDDVPFKSFYDKKYNNENPNQLEDMILTDKYFYYENNITENSEYSSNYFIKTLNYRSVLLSSLPFKLYIIVQNFYIELLKLKTEIEKTKIIHNPALDNSIIKEDSKYLNQLSVNQAVILLDKLGVFSLDYIENLPNTKKAKLISLLLGKNEKNIKSAIEKLEQKKADITDAYKKDLDKIQHILDNLE